MSEINYSIIAGKLAESKKLKPEILGKVPDILRECFQAVKEPNEEVSPLEYELQRLDEFISLVEQPENALHKALLLASYFRYQAYRQLNLRLDLKLSIAIGPVELRKSALRESDGTAIRLALAGLDSMKKNQRLVIRVDDENYNGEFEVACGFMDNLIHDWSDEQAEALFFSMKGMNQVKISEQLNISQPAVNRRLKAAHGEAIERFSTRYKIIIKSLLQT